MKKKLKEKNIRGALSVLPITVIVLALSFTLAPMPSGTMVLFLLGAAMLIVGMGFFSLGADIAMMPIGEQMGRNWAASGSWRGWRRSAFLIGAVVTIAEPDSAGAGAAGARRAGYGDYFIGGRGVGLFLVVSMLRTRFNLPLTPHPDRAVRAGVRAVDFCAQRVFGGCL